MLPMKLSKVWIGTTFVFYKPMENTAQRHNLPSLYEVQKSHKTLVRMGLSEKNRFYATFSNEGVIYLLL